MNKGFARTIIVLLVLLLAVQGYQLYVDIQAAEQQLIANEYQLEMLQVLALQHGKLMQLLIGTE